MNARFVRFFLLAVALAFTLGISAHPAKDKDDKDRDRDRENSECRNDEQVEHAEKTPVQLVGVVPIPGPNPLGSSDLLFADSVTEKVFVADRSNAGLDVLDAENNVFVGRIPGFAGNASTNTNGNGPNGVLTTNNKEVWAGDGNSALVVADIDPTHTSPLTYFTIIHSISTANSECDNGTVHECQRADELGWDPADHLILVNNDQPLSAATPHVSVTPYGTWVSTTTFKVVGQVLFPGAGGAEQPVWDPAVKRFFVTLPGTASPFHQATIAVIKPGASSVEKYLNLGDITGIANCTSANGLALGVNQHLLASACGSPVVLSALTGKLIHIVTQVGGGDEVWANPGDERFYVTSTDLLSKATPQPSALGVIDEESGTWLQNVDAVGVRNLAAFAETNHIFTAVRSSTTPTVCAQSSATGCVAVFDHEGSDPDDR
jgi:hypothetical protein